MATPHSSARRINRRVLTEVRSAIASATAAAHIPADDLRADHTQHNGDQKQQEQRQIPVPPKKLTSISSVFCAIKTIRAMAASAPSTIPALICRRTSTNDRSLGFVASAAHDRRELSAQAQT